MNSRHFKSNIFLSVNGGWGMWSPFTECSVSCNGGTKTRYRKCNSPLPDPDGVPCNASEATDHVTCHEEKCPGKK